VKSSVWKPDVLVNSNAERGQLSKPRSIKFLGSLVCCHCR